MFGYIEEAVSNDKIVLFMKGSKDFPQCGFSSRVVNILQNFNLEFKDYDVLKDSKLRADIKKFSNWNTIPQLYIKGKFIGGCDIVTELFNSGALRRLIDTEFLVSN